MNDEFLSSGEKKVLKIVNEGCTLDLNTIKNESGFSYQYTLSCLFNLRRLGVIKRVDRGVYSSIEVKKND